MTFEAPASSVKGDPQYRADNIHSTSRADAPLRLVGSHVARYLELRRSDTIPGTPPAAHRPISNSFAICFGTAIFSAIHFAGFL